MRQHDRIFIMFFIFHTSCEMDTCQSDICFTHSASCFISLILNLGVSPFSKVGIISNNRHEWATIAAATYSLSATLVPMYEAQLPKDWQHILNDSECSTLFCATEDIYIRVIKEVLPSAPLVKEVVCLDTPVEEPHLFQGLMMAHAKNETNDDDSVNAPSPEDLANLIYTSGTTGKPKVSLAY